MPSANKPALLLIDIQKGFDDIAYWGGERNNPDAEKVAAQLLAFWRERNWPLFHVMHCSTNPVSRLAPTHPGNEIKDEVKPLAAEPVIQKTVNSAFIGTDLLERLTDQGITQVVVAGLTTDHCVSTSVRMAGNLGFETFVAADATATFRKVGVNGTAFSAEILHQTALASLHHEFAEVLSAAEIMARFPGS